MNKNLIIIISLFLFVVSCVDKHFKIYDLSGELLKNVDYYKSSYVFDEFELYFNRKKIDREFEEINIIATDYYYYGQFFFDENFMSMIKSKSLDIGADAIIFEKGRKDFPDYNDNFLYFTAIKFKNNQ